MPLLIDVEQLTYGFDALGHSDGQVVFLPYAAPGDRVAAEVVTRTRDYLRADITAIVAPGPDRVTPPCPAFGTCGGCQWQHISATAQRAAKTAIVRDHLARIAGQRTATVAPILHAADPWAYRSRVTLLAEGRALGFHRRGSHALVPIDACPIAAPEISAHLASARAWVAALRSTVTRVTIARAAGGVVLVAELRGDPGDHDDDATAALCARLPTVRGAVLVGASQRRVVGDPTITIAVEPDLSLEVPADCFTQVNPAANQLLVAVVLALVAPGPGHRIFDAYCGAGNFTLPLARRGARVVGVERATGAVDALQRNATRLRLPVVVHAGDTATHARTHAAGDFDTIVLDPPRAGARAAIESLAQLRAARVVYVSCDPPTLARDIARFAAHGYRLGRVQPIDLFPQTYHVETVAELLLT